MMKPLTIYIRILSLMLFAVLFSAPATNAQSTMFTYRGKLPDDYNQPTALYDLRFDLYGQAGGANPPLNPSPLILEGVQVTGGEFTVSLDFGNLFGGGYRYLEIAVRPGDSAEAFTVLSPRQHITSSPYAIRSLSAAVAETAGNAQSLAGIGGGNFVLTDDPRLSDARPPTPGSDHYIQNGTIQQQGARFNIDGTGSADIFNAATQFNIAGNRVLSAPGTNLFAGINSGTANTTGSNNSMFGSSAGRSNTSGNDNSFFGVQAGGNNTTGGNNAFFGVNSGLANTAGHSNLFVGMQAGQGNTTGNNNSFVGYAAGLNNTTGTFNSLLGSNANVGADNLSYAAAIGSRAVVNSSDTIVLGKVAGTYEGVSRPADTIQIPGSLIVTGTISGNVAGVSLTNLNASNITSGTLDNARLGVIGVANGGTGLTSAGATGNFLRSNGAGFTSSPLTAADIPAGSANYIHNATTQQPGSNFNISGSGVAASFTASGTLSGSLVNAATQYNISGRRVLSLAGVANLFAGDGAGGSNTTGFGNAFVGANAGINNTEGNYNSFLAYNAGFSNTTGSNNAFFGTAAGFNNTTGNTNSFFGRSAGYSNTTGFANAFLGYSAGFSNTTGVGNSFVGNGAGFYNTSGHSNSFFGASAGLNNTTGLQNSILGANAGYNNTEGYSNSLVGYAAGYSNTTGHSNSFVGRAAGYNNTSGYSNAFFGVNAGLSNTTGHFNSFIGGAAGANNTTGFDNSFMGIDAGYSNTSGANGSFVGTYAGRNNTTGNGNSFFGIRAGLANTTGSNNTVLGANADVGSNNLSYATAIGAESTVATSNTVVLGRSAGQDTVLIPGLLQLNSIGAAGASQLCRNASNQVAACSSSLRYKTNIKPFSSGLDIVLRLQPITFTWKDGGMLDTGFAAEQVAAINPLFVTYNSNGEVEGIKYDRLSAVFVNALKEQQARIEAQQRQLEEQQALIEGLKRMLCRQQPEAEPCR